jgi:DNA invertase Pin-like site-specific DNA recombinase
MASGRFVAYYRVSTDRQGRSGLGLDAQRKAVEDYLNGGGWQLVGRFTEVESGKLDGRPELGKALAACRLHKAKLVIAKLDRLSRDAHFLLGLQKAGVPFVAADMPHADNFTVGILAMVAQKEREMISARTKAALAAAKARGQRLGGFRGYVPSDAVRAAAVAAKAAKARDRAADVLPTIREIRAAGITSLSGIAWELNARGVPTLRGGSEWQAVQVARVLRAAPCGP